jgi:hypothetical protein
VSPIHWPGPVSHYTLPVSLQGDPGTCRPVPPPRAFRGRLRVLSVAFWHSHKSHLLRLTYCDLSVTYPVTHPTWTTHLYPYERHAIGTQATAPGPFSKGSPPLGDLQCVLRRVPKEGGVCRHHSLPGFRGRPDPSKFLQHLPKGLVAAMCPPRHCHLPVHAATPPVHVGQHS